MNDEFDEVKPEESTDELDNDSRLSKLQRELTKLREALEEIQAANKRRRPR